MYCDMTKLNPNWRLRAAVLLLALGLASAWAQTVPTVTLQAGPGTVGFERSPLTHQPRPQGTAGNYKSSNCEKLVLA